MHAGRRGAGPFAGGGFVVDRSCDVSVIMAVYNGMPFLDRALDSLRVQTLGLERMQTPDRDGHACSLIVEHVLL